MGSIQLKDVRKAFGAVSIINGVNLNIENGEFAVFVGPSGCGKSTLLRLIAGLEDVTSGQVLIDAKDMTNVGPAQRGLAMVFQSYALYPHMSVRGNIAFALKMAGQSADVSRRTGTSTRGRCAAAWQRKWSGCKALHSRAACLTWSACAR